MKYIIILVLILYSSNVFALGFGKDTFVKIKTGDKGEKEFTFVDIEKMPIVYDADENEVHIGYFHKSDRDHLGHHKLIFTPLKTFFFDTESQFKNWIKSVKKSYKCLTVEGLVDC